MEKTLLEKALEANKNVKRKFDQKELKDLSFAWIKGEISYNQIRIALGLKNCAGITHYMAMGLKNAYELGLLQIKS